MKKFLRFIVTVLVISIVIGGTYFLIKESRRYKNNHPEEVEVTVVNKDDVISPKTEDKKEPMIPADETTIVIISGETAQKSGEEEPELPRSETFSTKEALIDSIKLIEQRNVGANVTNTIQDKVGEEVVGSKYKELFELLNTSTTSTTIQIAGSMIYIIPASDFLDSQQFHYDEDGNLVLYVVEGAGTGFKTKYYIVNETLIEKVGEDVGEIYDEANIESGEEMILDETDLQDVYTRARSLYSEYLKK